MKLDIRTTGRTLLEKTGCFSSGGSALAAIVFVILNLVPSAAIAQEVLATIPVGPSPFGVAINESTNRIYVANTQGSSVSVIDGSSNQVIATIPVAARPYSVAVNPSTNRLYVSHLDPNPGHAVDVIDGATNSVVAVLGVGYASVGVAVNPTTNRVYYGNALTRAVEVYDGATNSPVAVVTMPGGPSLAAMAVNPTTNMVYVATTSVPCQLYVIDGSSNTVVATVLNPFGNYVPQLAVNVGTNLLYVPSFWDDHVLVVDGATNNLLLTLSLPDCIYAAANPASNLVHFGTYNVNGGVNSVVTVNALTHDVVSDYVFDVNPSGINAVAGVAVNSSTNMVYVSNRLRNNVTVLSEPTVSSLAVTIDIKPGSYPNSFHNDGNGVLPVAILGDEHFEVTQVDTSSLLLDGLAVRVKGNNGPQCSSEDVNGDGYTDLICHFEDEANNWIEGTTTATLTGQLLDGTHIEGSDSISIVP